MVNVLAAGLVAALTLHGYGLRLVLQPGWHARLYRPPRSQPVVQAATFRLPKRGDERGSRAAQAMRRSDILVVILEQSPTAAGFAYRPARLPIRIVRANFLERRAGFPRGHAVARRTFSLNERKFQLYVHFGSRPVSAAQLRRANRLLAGFSSATPP